MVSFSKIALIAEREYMTRVAKKSFIILTILMPLIFVIISAVPAILMLLDGGDKQVVAVIDRTGEYFPVLKSNDQYQFVRADKPLSEYQGAGEDSDVTAILEIREDLLKNPQGISLFSPKTLPTGLENYINNELSDYLTDKKIASHDIPELKEIIRTSKVDISVATYKWDEDGAESASSGEASGALGLVLSLVSYMVIMIYGGMISQSVLEEKKSRIVEVIVSSVRPFELMMGKILGVGLVGLTQLVLWMVLMTGLSFGLQFFLLGDLYNEATASMAQQSMSGSTMELQTMLASISGINFFEVGVLFILFFIGGYFLYSSILAGLASTVSTDEEANQFMLPVTMLMIFSLYFGIAVAQNPDGDLAFWGSIIPFTSPVVMLARVGYDVPLWEQVLSIVVLYASFVLFTYLGARVYRVGIFMYGKKPTFKELYKWITYK